MHFPAVSSQYKKIQTNFNYFNSIPFYDECINCLKRVQSREVGANVSIVTQITSLAWRN
jgi:hypothetical protein